jgi:hypothetical protein
MVMAVTCIFVKVKRIRAGLGRLGDGPGGLVGDKLAFVRSNRAKELDQYLSLFIRSILPSLPRVGDGSQLLLLLVTSA